MRPYEIIRYSEDVTCTEAHVDQDTIHGLLPLFHQLIVVRFDNSCSFIPHFCPLFLAERLLEFLLDHLGSRVVRKWNLSTIPETK